MFNFIPTDIIKIKNGKKSTVIFLKALFRFL